jgi:HSP20 family protein
MNLIPRNSLFDFDNIFNGFWSPSREIGESTDVAFSPRVDIEEKKDRYKITAELPGIDKKDVHVSLKNGVLNIEAESHQEDTEEEDGRVIRQERRYSKFIRSFNLGRDCQGSRANNNDCGSSRYCFQMLLKRAKVPPSITRWSPDQLTVRILRATTLLSLSKRGSR